MKTLITKLYTKFLSPIVYDCLLDCFATQEDAWLAMTPGRGKHREIIRSKIKINEIIELTYYAKLTPQKNGYLLTLQDFDHIFTEGDTLEEALPNANEALDGILAQMLKDNDNIPIPSVFHKGEYPVN